MKKIFRLRCCVGLLMVFVLLTGLTGCRLATDGETGKEAEDDVLCGSFLTFELVMDTQKTTVINTPDMGGGVGFKNKPFLDEGIIKGVQQGNTVKFEGVNGYFVGFIPEIRENVSNIVTVADKGFTDLSQMYNDIDNKKEMISSATFLVPTNNINSFYVYPVYKKEDGTFYILSQDVRGNSFTGNMPDTSCTVKFEDYTKESLNGNVAASTKHTFTITIKTVDPTIKMVVKEMGSKDEVITVADIKYKGSNTIDYKVTPATDYVIVEETKHNVQTGNYIKRSIYSFGEEKSFYCTYNFPTEKDSIGSVSLNISK